MLWFLVKHDSQINEACPQISIVTANQPVCYTGPQYPAFPLFRLTDLSSSTHDQRLWSIQPQGFNNCVVVFELGSYTQCLFAGWNVWSNFLILTLIASSSNPFCWIRMWTFRPRYLKNVRSSHNLVIICSSLSLTFWEICSPVSVNLLIFLIAEPIFLTIRQHFTYKTFIYTSS